MYQGKIKIDFIPVESNTNSLRALGGLISIWIPGKLHFPISIGKSKYVNVA